MVVSLVNNRFCFKKGTSHKSNGIYLVINQKRWVVYQKCHDVADCPDFRSHEFALPDARALTASRLAYTYLYQTFVQVRSLGEVCVSANFLRSL